MTSHIQDGSSAEATTRLPPDPHSARVARRFLDATLARWDRQELTEVAELLTSELVANVVLHAGTPMKLCVRQVDAEAVVVEVTDEAEPLPELRDPPTGATEGRGLFLVDAMAADWGVDSLRSGKRIWFRVPGPR